MTAPKKTTTRTLRKRAKKKPTFPRPLHDTSIIAGIRIDHRRGYTQARGRTAMRPSQRDELRKKLNGFLIWGRLHKPDPNATSFPRPLVLEDVVAKPTARNPLQTRRRNRARNKQARASRRLNR